MSTRDRAMRRMVDMQSAMAEIKRGKDESKKNKRQDENIYIWPGLLHTAAIINQPLSN